MEFNTSQWSNEWNMEVPYVNSWIDNNFYGNNMQNQYNQGWRNYENLSYENPNNFMNHSAGFQPSPPIFPPQPVEKKQSLEDLVSSFIAESRMRCEKVDLLSFYLAKDDARMTVSESRMDSMDTYMVADQSRDEVQYVNNWSYNNCLGNDLPTQHYSDWRNHENLSYGNTMDAMNSPVGFQFFHQPQQAEKEPSIEEFMNSLVTEYKTRYNLPEEDKPSFEDLISDYVARLAENEARVERLETHIDAPFRNFETQISQFANPTNNLNKDVFLSDDDFCENLEDYVANDESIQYPLEHCNENSMRQDIEDTVEVMEHVLVVEEPLEDKVSNQVEPLEEEPLGKEVKGGLELMQLPKSLRYAFFSIDSCFSVIIPSSFTGMEQEKPWHIQDKEAKFNIFKGMKLHTEDNDCFKIYVVDEISEEFSEIPIDNTEAMEYVYQVGAPEKFYKPLPRFKEPEHRKAKFHLKDERP